MKGLIFFIGLMLFVSCSPKNKVRYFYEFEEEISKSEFNKIHREKNVLLLIGDSIHHKVLVNRRVEGTIKNRSILNHTFSELTKSKIDSLKPLVIIYYPGKDPCNSTLSARSQDKSQIEFNKKWVNDIEYGTQQLAQSKPIFVYKSEEGLNDYNGLITWYKDPNGVIERLFFKKHYPCNSFVVINKDGNFISYFGEFMRSEIWKAVEQLYP